MITRVQAIQQLTAPGQPLELVEVEVHGRRVRAFRNAPPTLRDLYQSVRSDLPFIVYEDERLTFEETWRRACTLAAALVEDYGVGKGDRVAISMRNYPEWMIAFMAATSIGAIAVAMNALWQPHEMDYALEDCAPKVLLADQERLTRLAATGSHASLPLIAVRAAALPANGRAWDEVLSRTERSDMPVVEMAPDDDAIMLYTSGTTGNAKGAVSTHRNVISALLSWELDAQSNVLRGVLPAPVVGGPQGGGLLAIPLFHVTGLHAVFLGAFRAQRRVVTMYKWDAEKGAELIERERLTNFMAPPTVTGDLVEVAKRSGRDLTSLAAVGGGGAARAPEQVRGISHAFGNARPNTGWGMTETNAIGTGHAGPDYLNHPESAGLVSAVLDIRIVGEDGRELPVMQRGELQIRGASVVRGYWNRPDADAEAFVDGWFRTGDVAYVDNEGFVYIVDRLKDMVIRGGENIGCAGVESAIVEHPAVLEACVYGVPDQRLGEEVGATVYAIGPVTEAELRAFLEPRLARFQIPRYITIVAEPLPRIASGKILKRQLRAEAIDRLAVEA